MIPKSASSSLSTSTTFAVLTTTPDTRTDMEPTHYIVRSAANTCGGHNIRAWVGSSLGPCPSTQRLDIGGMIRVGARRQKQRFDTEEPVRVRRWKVIGHAMIGENSDVPIALLREVA